MLAMRRRPIRPRLQPVWGRPALGSGSWVVFHLWGRPVQRFLELELFHLWGRPVERLWELERFHLRR